jgi:CHAT domain-containing protein
LTAFYRHGGARDPARALAATQLDLAAELPAHQWAGFVILGAPPRLGAAR